jgi:hypothetical protein
MKQAGATKNVYQSQKPDLEKQIAATRQQLVKARQEQRRYEELEIDVTGTEPLLAIHTSLPDDTVCDVYRLTLTGEAETAPDLNHLHQNLDELFFELQLRDETRLRRSLWEAAEEDTLRGLFLRRLQEKLREARTEEEKRRIEQAARWGLAALDNAEEVVRHDHT